LLPNGGVYNESGFTAEWCCLQRINIRYQNDVVCSESAFVAEIV
jgi:hypothetical protein